LSAETISEAFVNRLEQWGGKTAISYIRDGRLESRLSYSELHRDIRRAANAFLGMQVAKGDRVILFLPKSLSAVVAGLALQRIGAIAVPLNPGFTSTELTYFLEDADPCLVLAGTAQTEMVESLTDGVRIIHVPDSASYQDLDIWKSHGDAIPRIDLRGDDPSLIIYTSGTTGQPKGAVLTQKNLIHDAENIIRIWEIDETDRLCHALPLFHVHGLCFALHTALLAGAHVVMLAQFSPDMVIRMLAEGIDGIPDSQSSVFMAVPSMYQKVLERMDDAAPDFSRIRLLTSGSAPLLPRDFERIRDRFGMEPVEREGMSETGMNFSNPIHGPRRPGSIGLPLPGLKVRTVDPESLEDVDTGGIGEIWLKSDAISPGYWRKTEATDDAFHRGWFRTGDLGRIDDDGHYYLTDRIKHIIISGGENISPKEIESVINRCPDVAESSVVGIPDEVWGERVVAAVVPKPGAANPLALVRSLCKDHLHRWKIPKSFVLMEALPKNTMGKVLVEKVKEAFEKSK